MNHHSLPHHCEKQLAKIVYARLLELHNEHDKQITLKELGRDTK